MNRCGSVVQHLQIYLWGVEAAQGLGASPVIVGIDEVAEVRCQLSVAVVVVALDRRFLDRAVHAFDLAVGPGMPDLGQPVLDSVLAAAHVEHVRDVLGRWPIRVAGLEGELDAVVGQHRVYSVSTVCILQGTASIRAPGRPRLTSCRFW